MATINELMGQAVRAHRSGDLAQAEELYRQALRLDPNMPRAHYHLGMVLRAQGRLAEAAACYRQVLQLEPVNGTAQNNLGNVLKEQGQLDEATACYRRAIHDYPLFTEAHLNLGNALKERGQLDEAIACYRQALRTNPQHAQAHNFLGLALARQGQLVEAVGCYRQALRASPNLAEAHVNLGNVLKQQGQLAEAAACYRQALKINPKLLEAHNDLGNVLERQGEPALAIASYRQALALNPDQAEPHYNLSIALNQVGQFREAHARNDEALRINPAHALALWNRSLLHLLEGDFASGWREYELRFAQSDGPRQLHHGPRWDGAPLEGRTILVYAEQGLGDTIQFVRYLPMVKDRGGKVLLECQPELLELLRGVAGADEIVDRGASLPAYDVQVPLLSLPGIFGTTLHTIPAGVPYLRAEPGLVEHWKKELEPVEGFKIGIAWQGRRTHNEDRFRSVSLAHFEPLARVSGVRLVSLQLKPGADQLAAASFSLTDLGSRFNPGSLGDVAAALVNMDLVVTVDTAVAHLAGALGVPTWVLVPLPPDWRWLLERSDSPWYPTMRLFRQTRYGDWGEVFQRVAAEVALLRGGR